MITITLRAETYFGVYADLELNIVNGCFEETLISGSAISPLPTNDPSIEEYTTNGVLFKIFLPLYDPSDPGSEYASYSLKDLIVWETDIDLCYASKISLVTDETGATLSTATDVFLDTNPTLKDEISGLMDPVLIIQKS